MGRGPSWSYEEMKDLEELYPSRSNREVVEQMKLLGYKRSLRSVITQANRMGLKKSKERLSAMGLENGFTSRQNARGTNE